MLEQIVRGPLLVPSMDGSVAYYPDGAIGVEGGVIQFADLWPQLAAQLPSPSPPVRKSDGVILPPLLDMHTHIPQHPIRGRFAEGVPDDAPGGRLLNGLKRNVFPTEMRCNATDHACAVIEAFRNDTLSHGVVGGATYMMTSAAATEAALEILPQSWSVGLVMMNQNCPEGLRTDESNLEADVARLAGKFGRRMIVTDRFAVAVDTPLRQRGSRLAERFGLRTQTHLNEQDAEKRLIETELYPKAASYTDVYRRDGLLDHQCIAAHCIHMNPAEWRTLAETGSVVAHCPTSNLLLGSGLMSLDRVIEHKIPYAICTDMGASPTVSMLAEMKRFVQVHSGISARATPSEALWRATLAPAIILGLEKELGRLEAGRPASFIEVSANGHAPRTADEAIAALLPGDPDHPPMSVARVTIGGKTAYQRSASHA